MAGKKQLQWLDSSAGIELSAGFIPSANIDLAISGPIHETIPLQVEVDSMQQTIVDSPHQRRGFEQYIPRKVTQTV